MPNICLSTIFRGIDAAASLKHEALMPLPPYLGVIFRGIDAAASLKPIRPGVDQGDAPDLPRHRCRGLIEARNAASLLYLTHSHLPRHRCRGLIEAWMRYGFVS